MHRTTFAELSADRGAAAINAVFQEYPLPMQFTAEQFERHVLYNDVDLTSSPLWYDEAGNVLGAALLAVRGARGWVGGFGIAPEHRGHGYARELLDAIRDMARARGVEVLQLEVLSENAPAIRLYERGGFQRTRMLRSFKRSVIAPPVLAEFRFADPDEYVEKPNAVALPWQRETTGLRHGAVSTAVAGPHGEYALFRYNEQAAQVFKLQAGDAGSLDALALAIASSCAVESIFLLNEPEESPIAEYARTAGWTQPFSQYEMKLRLE
jgi:GNAT superfamily N-acetyltransferase